MSTKNEEQQSQRDSVREMFYSPALDSHGQQVTVNGKKASNIDLVNAGLMKAAAKGNTKAAELLFKQAGLLEVEAGDPVDKEKLEEEQKRSRKLVNARLKYYRTRIEDILKDAGIYEPRQTFQIEVCATMLMSLRKIREAYLDNGEPCYVIELSREGMPRKKPNPLLAELRSVSDSVAKHLAKLTMNVKDAKKKEDADDKFDEFMKQFHEDDE